MSVEIVKAKLAHAAQIHKLVNHFADNGLMLARPLSEIYENIRDYFVVCHHDEVLGCAALHVSWEDLAEIKSLAVADKWQHHGLGSRLVEACLEEASHLGIETVFSLTYVPSFFEKLGFKMVDKSRLPHKVWGECYLCPKFPNCDEVAVVYVVNHATGQVEEIV